MATRLGVVLVLCLGLALTATGTVVRRSLVLVLYDSSKPASIPASDWTPRGLCNS